MKVTFDQPPRIGHHPPHIDGCEYIWSWRRRLVGLPEPPHATPSAKAGWFDADNAIRLGRDIGQNELAKGKP